MSMSRSSSQRVWPLSLLALRASSKALSLPREQNRITCYKENSRRNKIDNVSSLTNENVISGNKTQCLTHENLKNLFLKQVKPKKRHETIAMAEICVRAAIESGVSCIVDVGGGKGHLARLLAYGYGFRVCCIEAQEDLITSARELDNQLEYTAAKYLGIEYVRDLPRPEYISMMVGQSTEAVNQFKKEVLQKLKNTMHGECLPFGIVGLHPCGDLAASLLHIFADLKEVKFICIASCCYMKLSLDGESQNYPLSQFFYTLPKCLTHLKYEALEVSCHALESYCQRLQSQQYHVLKIHGFRAVLEKLIVKYHPGMRHTGLRSVKNFNELDFPMYAEKALSRVEGVSIPLSDLTSMETLEDLERWQDVVSLYSLRLLLAPLIETAVILDRLLFIQEQGGIGVVIPGFDPVISPRNLIIQGLKI